MLYFHRVGVLCTAYIYLLESHCPLGGPSDEADTHRHTSIIRQNYLFDFYILDCLGSIVSQESQLGGRLTHIHHYHN